MSQTHEEYWLKRKLADLGRVYNFTEERIRMLKRDYKQAIKDIRNLLRDGDIKDYEKRRLKLLQKQIEKRLEILFELEEAYVTRVLWHTFEEEYYHGIFNLNQLVGYGAGTYYLAPDVIESAITTAWSRANYSDRIWKRKKELGKTVEEILRKGMLMGYSNARMTKQLAEQMDVSLRQAGRLIRTETCYVANQATLQSYKELDVEEYEFLATLDLLTSQTCRHLDGKKYPRNQAQVGLNYPPMHPHCRSSTIPVVDETEGIEEKRLAKDVDREYYEVPASMKYEEWYEKYVKTNPEYLLLEKKIKNRYADEKKYARYQEILGKNAPRTFDEFQEMKYNDGDEWGLFQDYVKSIKREELTSLASFNLYKSVSKEIDEKLIGLTTSNGIQITGKSKHFIARVIGSVVQKRSGVPIDNIISAITSPTRVTAIRELKNGRSQRFSLDNTCSVSVNPDTGILIQVNPYSSRKDG